MADPVLEVETEIVVVGAGGAGLASAVSAAELGARVLVVERLATRAGTTAWSVGSFAGADSSLQKKSGISDSAEDFSEDIVKTHPEAHSAPELRSMYAQRSGETLDWLERLGVAFVGPYPEPPNRVNRLHQAVPNGRAYLDVLNDRAVKLGIDIQYSSEAVTLCKNEHGQVDGVLVRKQGALVHVRAKSVILAAGDFSASVSLKKIHVSPAAAAALPINPESLGLGHKLALDAGAEMLRMDLVFGPQLRFAGSANKSWIDQLPIWPAFRRFVARFVAVAPRALVAPIVRKLLVSHMSPVHALFEKGAHLVSSAGADLGRTASAVAALALTEDKTGYIIGTAALAKTFNEPPNFLSTAPGIAFAYFRDYETARPDLVHHGSDLGDLAHKLLIPPEQLCAALPELSQGAVFALGPVQAMLTVTEGGVAIDTKCRVLNSSQEPIEGLYAAGGNGLGGLVLKGHGLHIGWAITSGRVAGQAAAMNR